MNLSDARTWILDAARNAGEPGTYSAERVDMALQFVGNQFCRTTHYLRRAASVTLTPSSPAVSFAAVSEFRPERLTQAYVVGFSGGVSIEDWQTVYDLVVDQASAGVPTKLAFEDDDVCNVWPIPDIAYTMRFRFWRPFTTWTLGAEPSGVTLNLPDDVLMPILRYGAPAALQHSEPETLYANESWKKYLDWERSMVGANSPPVQTARRCMQL